jgi:hypothetical protein
MKPLLFLDIDGVVNCDSKRHSERYVVRVPVVEMPVHPFINVPATGAEYAEYEVNFDPRYRAWLAELGEVFELVWASTWEHNANRYISELLGLGELGVVEHSLEPVLFSEAKSADVVRWKWRTITEYAKGRPLAFVDDHAGRLASSRELRVGVATLVLAPTQGLTRKHVERLVEFARGLDQSAE